MLKISLCSLSSEEKLLVSEATSSNASASATQASGSEGFHTVIPF